MALDSPQVEDETAQRLKCTGGFHNTFEVKSFHLAPPAAGQARKNRRVFLHEDIELPAPGAITEDTVFFN